MDTKSTLWAQVDENGRLIIPTEVSERFGLQPGARLRVDQQANAIHLHRPATNLAKVYIEPTNQCNLNCRTCIRHAWEEATGMMSDESFAKLMTGISHVDPTPLVSFGGLGEPLSHPRITEWVRQAKALGATVELITNGTLLSEENSRALIDAGLDVLWVSIDGATPESYADVRLGAELPQVIENMVRFRRLRPWGHLPKPVIGVAFVAMKRNIDDLPKIIALGRRFDAKRFMVSNVLPYTAEMQAETLYTGTLKALTYIPSPWLPSLSLPRMDIDESTKEAFLGVLTSGCNIEFSGYNLGGANDVCTFIASGAISVGWRGDVSPCPPLLYNHTSYLHGKPRFSRRHVIGNINRQDLSEIWMDPEYVAYRERVLSFAFAPCTPCAGCELTESNDLDCYGVAHPACGSCLWAQGVIQCP
jgi:MoaA/NifB/PqqE/SkfB family radical SAM enzyme